MVTASLSRGSTVVSFELAQESGNPTVIQTVGKPEQEFKKVSRPNPRVSDQFQSLDTFILRGYVDGDTAYSKARRLAEDLIKPFSEGEELTLELSNLEGFDRYSVAPIGESVLELTYPPGQRDWVTVDLNLTRVDNSVGGVATEESTSSSALANDSGSVTIRNPATSDSVTLEDGLTLTRTVGRPNTTVINGPNESTYYDKVRSTVDEWGIDATLTSDTARADSQTLMDILGYRTQRDGLRLEFDNNLYGLSTYNVAASGSEAGRRIINASEPGMARIKNVTLRTITV